MSVINRDNYEMYFLLYVDNELAVGERIAVETFVAANPDLQLEFDMLQQAVMQPKETFTFPGKENLYKNASAPETLLEITQDNYSAYFVLYADGELNASQRSEVELFVKGKPALQEELALYLQAKVEPDYSITYNNKADLYKEEKSRKIIPFWFRMAAAAIIIFIGGYWLMSSQTSTTKQIPVAQSGSATVDTHPATADVQKVQKTAAPVTNDTSKPLNIAKAERKFIKKEKMQVQFVKNDKQVTTSNSAVDTNPGDQNTYANLTQFPDKKAAPVAIIEGQKKVSTEKLGSHYLIPDKQPAMTPLDAVTSLAVMPDISENSSDDLAVGPVHEKRNKMRGLIRKVSRVFDKPSSNDNEKNAVLVGSFQIALK